MALFLSANIHQGDDLFSICSRGKQCAFMSLSALLSAFNSGFIVLDPCVEYLCVDDLPKVVNVSFDRNMFSYQICHSQTVQRNKAATVSQDNTDLAVEVAQNSIDLPVVVAQNSSDLPMVVAQNSSDLPKLVTQNTSDPSMVVTLNTSEVPMMLTQLNDKVPVNINVQPDQDLSESQIWTIHYAKELQGLVIGDQEIESHYYNIHTALLNTFLNFNHAILILECYMIAIIKQTDFFYLFDSHARDVSGMPNPNGTAVIMRFTNILELEQYLYCLSSELHTNSYEIVPVQISKCTFSCDIQKKNRLQK